MTGARIGPNHRKTIQFYSDDHPLNWRLSVVTGLLDHVADLYLYWKERPTLQHKQWVWPDSRTLWSKVKAKTLLLWTKLWRCEWRWDGTTQT